MHGLSFETSVWLLAESTRLLFLSPCKPIPKLCPQLNILIFISGTIQGFSFCSRSACVDHRISSLWLTQMTHFRNTSLASLTKTAFVSPHWTLCQHAREKVSSFTATRLSLYCASSMKLCNWSDTAWPLLYSTHSHSCKLWKIGNCITKRYDNPPIIPNTCYFDFGNTFWNTKTIDQHHNTNLTSPRKFNFTWWSQIRFCTIVMIMSQHVFSIQPLISNISHYSYCQHSLNTDAVPAKILCTSISTKTTSPHSYKEPTIPTAFPKRLKYVISPRFVHRFPLATRSRLRTIQSRKIKHVLPFRKFQTRPLFAMPGLGFTKEKHVRSH